MAQYQPTSESTQHGLDTPYGLNTPHRLPTLAPRTIDVLNGLVKGLYPTGRAWTIPENSNFENFHKALNDSFTRLVDHARSIVDSTLPDNDLFDEEDAALWEYRLGLITNVNVDLVDRRNALLRKIAFPSNIPARQHPNYIQFQLRLAGFDVYVHENQIPYQTPDDVVSVSLSTVQHGGDTQHGLGTQHGSGTFNVIANSLNPNELFNVGGDDNLYSTFFIGGQNLGDTASIPESRQLEFRELVLKLKPAHTVAFTIINFI